MYFHIENIILIWRRHWRLLILVIFFGLFLWINYFFLHLYIIIGLLSWVMGH